MVYGIRKIAIFRIRGYIGILAVNGILIWGRDFRNASGKLRELFEERPVEIEIATVVEGIPRVRPPEILVVHLERLVRRKNRNDRFARSVAIATVEVALVAKGKAALLAAIGTEGR